MKLNQDTRPADGNAEVIKQRRAIDYEILESVQNINPASPNFGLAGPVWVLNNGRPTDAGIKYDGKPGITWEPLEDIRSL